LVWAAVPQAPVLHPDKLDVNVPYFCTETYGPIHGWLEDWDTLDPQGTPTLHRDVEWDWDWVVDAGHVIAAGEEDYLHGWESIVDWVAPDHHVGGLIYVYALAYNNNTEMGPDMGQGWGAGGAVWERVFYHDPNCPIE
jgi:hypothetical protein